MVLQSQDLSTSASGTRPGLLLVVLCGAPFLAALDLLIVNVAFAEIGRDFRSHSLADVSWILNAYAITYASLLIPLGRYADRVGHKQVFLAGLGLFTLASAAAAASPTLWVLVGLRVAQGIGAAAVTPTSLGLLLRSVGPERRAGAVRIWATSGAVAAALGPLLGGLLVEVSWRWVFLVNLPVGVALAWLAWRHVGAHHHVGGAASPDLVGTALLTVGVGAVATALVRGPEWGWVAPEGLTVLAVALAALVWFVLHNRRHPEPLLDHDLLRVPQLVWSNAGSLFFNAAFAAGLLALILFLQGVWGYTALETGLAVAPGPLVVPVFAFAGQVLARRLTAGTLVAAGSLLWAAGTLMVMLSVDEQPAYATAVLPGWLICGVGVGLALPTIMSSATAGLPPQGSATGSALVGMTRQIGIVLGVAAFVAVYGAPGDPAAVLEAFDRGWRAAIGLAFLSAVVATRMSPRRAPVVASTT